jgi:opacity protein-like surface antigen
MKRFVLVAVVLFAVPLFAQQPKNDFQIFAYSSNLGVTWNESYGTAVDTNWGIAVQKFVAPHVSMELAVVSQGWYEYEPGPYHFGVPIVRYRQRSYPVSLDGQYHFFNGSRWKPYLGVGLRYVDPNARLRDIGARISPEVNGGVSFMFTPRFSLRFDGKQELRSPDGPAYDPPSRVSVGLGWHF